MTDRRGFLKTAAGGTVLAGSGLLTPWLALAEQVSNEPATLPAGTVESSILEALAEKRPLIKRSYRPPNYETPVALFDEAFTPNDAFFVRYHLANIPRLDAQTWTLRVGGEAAQKPLGLTLAELRNGFEAVELNAVCQCSGNRRGLSQPHVPGVEWGYGAMGNARWKGVRLKDLLNRAGIAKEAVEVSFDGADTGVLPTTPDFVKSLPLWKALDENTLIAFEMNGAPLPHWNGFPARLVVPGWTGTYWLKHLTTIQLVAKPFDGFWMKTAYRIPKGKFPVVDRFLSQETELNTPITEMLVNSLFTNLEDGQRLKLGQAVDVKGIAWDGGYGIQNVQYSIDGGASWRNAELGKDHGRFSWIQWGFRFAPAAKGSYSLMARASNRSGASQVFAAIWNPAGYHHNVVQTVRVQVV